MLESNAWENLTNAARVAYIHIFKKFFFNYKKPVSTTYTEMERFMTRDTYANAIRRLEENGIIQKTQRGGIFRRRNYFTISESWRQIGKEETDIKEHIHGISIKGGQMHTVESVEKGSTGMQMHTVDLKKGT
jgi:predicted transcriptional regulator